MICPDCGEDDSKVMETRRHHDEIWRRRRCSCSRVFFTTETLASTQKMPMEIIDASLARLQASSRRRKAR